MTSKIFRSILATSMIVLAATLAIITTILYDYYGSVHTGQLKDELAIASAGTESLGKEYLQKISSDNYRLTWVDSDGSVLFDSKADEESMDNHLNREEIAEAFENGNGSSSRHSATLTEETLYEAVLLSDGTVLRISVNRASGFSLFVGMFYPVLVVVIVAAIISGLIAHKMSKKIIEPLNKLDLDNPLENDTYEELSPLLTRIHRQNMKIRRKAAELIRRKEEFNLITENMREGLVLLDKNRNVLTINPAAAAIFGTDRECTGKDFLTVDRRQDIEGAIEKGILQGHSEIRAVRNDREYQFDISRIETEGETVGAVILGFDITEQADGERLRREFSANVSHELKTPLQSITGSAELIENGLVKPDDLPRFVGHIREEAARLVSLVDDIIKLSRLDEGSEMPRENVSLLAVAKDVCDMLRSKAESGKITLSVYGDSGDVCAVKQLIFEIVFNLCDNAVKYTPEGGKVEVRVSETENQAVLTVSDTGIGIPAEHQGRIFERFYRADKSHSKKSGGTGLGLSIVKHAVMYHGGNIELTSEVNKGTVVSVVLPKGSREPDEAAPDIIHGSL